MQNPRLFGHAQNFSWREQIVDSTFTDTLKEPCAKTISSAGYKGCIKSGATIFANGAN